MFRQIYDCGIKREIDYMIWFSDYHIDDISAVYDEDGNLLWAIDSNAPDKLYPEKDCDKHDETVSENFFVRMLKAWKRHRNEWKRAKRVYWHL